MKGKLGKRKSQPKLMYFFFIRSIDYILLAFKQALHVHLSALFIALTRVNMNYILL